MDTRRTAYRALLNEQCPSCRYKLDQSYARLSRSSGDRYSTTYTCPHCDTTTQYTISIQSSTALVTVQSTDGELISNNRKPLAQLAAHGQSSEQQFNQIHFLETSLDIVYQNLNRLFIWGESFPEFFEQVSRTSLADLDNHFENDLVVNLGRDSRWIDLHTDVHNYLSSVYSHHQFVENTIASIIASDAESDRLQKQYNEDNKALLGLRHYTQHRMVAPLRIRQNTGTADRVVDILIDLNDLRDFDYRHGFNHWFGDVDENYIDLIERGVQHYQNAGNHAIERIKTARDENEQSFQELEDLREEYPTLDDINIFTNRDGE
ncbi:hypothetical protein [Haladaptatus sp. CMAA 1911]|uniref:hypothetical protein n=1 Tax=unclassified Haladaptatus TaxID=2622732 RepID=UPI0037546FA5